MTCDVGHLWVHATAWDRDLQYCEAVYSPHRDSVVHGSGARHITTQIVMAIDLLVRDYPGHFRYLT